MASKIAKTPQRTFDFDNLTTAEKVGAGVGALAITGSLAYFVYWLGRNRGWWGATATPVVIDQQPQQQSSSTRPSNTNTTTSTSSGSRATGNPPNLSGNTAGYDTTMFPDPRSVRAWLREFGYDVADNNDGLKGLKAVSKFQANWNAAVKAIGELRPDEIATMLGGVSFDVGKLDAIRGLLTVDDVPGPNTLNAMTVLSANKKYNNINWKATAGK